MIYLVLSMVLSASLFVLFKWFDTLKIKLIPVIIGNYLTCICIGLLAGGTYKNLFIHSNFDVYSLVLGVLFFIVFYAMGFASSTIGIGISSAASKLSLLIPVAFGAIVLNESFGIFRILSLVLVIPAVLLMSYSKDESWKMRSFLIPLFIWVGSGTIDTSLNVLQMNIHASLHGKVILFIFTGAFVSSMIFASVKKIPLWKHRRSIAFGIALGIPNYLSIHYMLRALHSEFITSSQFYMINNTGVMLLSFISAALLFSEKVNLYKVLGILLSGVSLFLMLIL